MKTTIVRANRESCEEQTFDYEAPGSESGKRPMVLDVLLQAQAQSLPDLAYRYGCRNALCGVCTVNVNGKPKLACRTKVREGDTISALSTLPVLRDLVVKRDAINRQLRGRIPATGVEPEQAADTSNAQNAGYLSLNRCIECYACLSACPLHGKNDLTKDEYEHGNPYSFLKLHQVFVDPHASEDNKVQASATALQLGLDTCLSCKGCSCGVGIDLRKEVIQPLLETGDLISCSSDWPLKSN